VDSPITWVENAAMNIREVSGPTRPDSLEKKKRYFYKATDIQFCPKTIKM
jgi:hypothetical protein